MLRNNGIDVEIIEYLKKPITIEELKVIETKLKLNPKEFLRKNDTKYKELNLDKFDGTHEQLFEIIIQNPRILERPIIISGEKAVIGRPPENILKLL